MRSWQAGVSASSGTAPRRMLLRAGRGAEVCQSSPQGQGKEDTAGERSGHSPGEPPAPPARTRAGAGAAGPYQQPGTSTARPPRPAPQPGSPQCVRDGLPRHHRASKRLQHLVLPSLQVGSSSRDTAGAGQGAQSCLGAGASAAATLPWPCWRGCTGCHGHCVPGARLWFSWGSLRSQGHPTLLPTVPHCW